MNFYFSEVFISSIETVEKTILTFGQEDKALRMINHVITNYVIIIIIIFYTNDILL